MPNHYNNPLIIRAAARYRPPGKAGGGWAQGMARGKLAGDPVFFGILRHGLIPDGARVLDLGCGKALFEALLCAAWADPDGLPNDVPRLPRYLHFNGLELDASDVASARQAVGKAGTIVAGDICQTAFPETDLVLILDVLHYIPHAAQEDVLRRARDALQQSNGRLLLRVGDADQGFRFRWSQWVDRLVVFMRCGKWLPLWGRPLTEWIRLLQRIGFSVRQIPMSEGTGFANVLLVADMSARTEIR
ncbi:MAG: class I SAM-dependent methyltransferase [Rhodocyclaceae bacterium]